MITASALPRLFACPGSAALSEARTESAWSKAGTDLHQEQQDAIDAGDLDEMPPKIRALIPADATSVRSEVALAYDWSTGRGRELGVGLDRGYVGLSPTEIPGTTDMVAIAPGRALVADWKFVKDVGAPDRNEQALIYGLAVAKAHPHVEEVTLAIGYLVTGRVEHAMVDVIELDAFGAHLRKLHERIAEQKAKVAAGHLPDVSEGRHCENCPAVHVCPARIALLRRLIGGQETDEMELLLPLDATAARMAYERLQAGKSLLRRIDRALYAYASEQPIDLGDGRYFGRHAKLGNERLDGDAAYDIVRQRYGQDVADQVVTRAVTKKRLGEVLKPIGRAADREVIDAIRAAGGATRETKEAVEEYSMRDLIEANGGI